LHLAIEKNVLDVVNLLLSQGANTSIINDGKKPLDLAEGCNNIDIIDVLKSHILHIKLHLSVTERLLSYNSRTVAAITMILRRILQIVQFLSRPLKWFFRLIEDERLEFGNNEFQTPILEEYANKRSAIDQLKATPPYPTPHVLAQFASIAYHDYTSGDPEPPDGWQLLTTASHCGMTNGYFGIAYWHPQRQQVVIAHRGTETDFKKDFLAFCGTIFTDGAGVILNINVPQMSSASTFANKVAEVLHAIYQEKQADFEIFFTGHSLGGWLAQITAFTTEYLEVKEGTFCRKMETEQVEPLANSSVQDTHNVRQSYHPQTVVFDSAGCKAMLTEMKSTHDVTQEGGSILLQHLDITSYLSAPNIFNSCTSHLGTIYRILTVATHNIATIKDALDPETAQAHREPYLLEVIGWPDGPTKVYDEQGNSLSVFTQDQQDFLGHYFLLRQVEVKSENVDSEYEGLFSKLGGAVYEEEAREKLKNFNLEKERIRCEDASALHALIPYVKRLVRLFPVVKEKLLSFEIPKMFYELEMESSVATMKENTLDFIPEALSLEEFLTNGQQILHLKMVDKTPWTGIANAYRVLENTTNTHVYCTEGHYTILNLNSSLLIVNRVKSLSTILTTKERPHLLMIACENNQPVDDELRDMFSELFSILKQDRTIKIVLATSEGDTAASLAQIATQTLGEGFVQQLTLA
jgi:hypothetical protein